MGIVFQNYALFDNMTVSKNVSCALKFHGVDAAAMFIAGLFAPLGSLFMRITPEGLAQVVHSPQFSAALWNSIATGLIATIISVALGLAAAWSLERTAIRAKNFFAITFGVPMLIPSISHSFEPVALFGANGRFTNIFRWDF